MPVADLVLKNANVITADSGQPSAQLVAAKDNKIFMVGGNDKLEEVSGAKTKIIDCQGKTVVPGFNDAHCHLFALIRKLIGIDLNPSSVRSIDNIKAAIIREAQHTPHGQWLIGTGYNEFYLTEKRHPTRRDIDNMAPHHPVILVHHSLHACVLNSLALSLAGITNETPEPPGGTIERYVDTGEPNGILLNMLGYLREKVVPPLSEEELANGISLANENYLSQGITSLQEATVTNDLSRWQTLRRLKDNGKLKSRVYMMPGIGAIGQFQEAGLVSGAGNSQLRLGGIKIIPNETAGQLYPPQLELNRQVLDAHRAGFQLAIHAIEQHTVEAAIIALENAQGHVPLTGRRHRIEHCSECPPYLLERLSNLKSIVVTQPSFLHYSGERYLATVPPDQQQWLYRIKSFLDSGLVVAGSSDSPVDPDDPLVGMYAAVTRQSESGQQLIPRECISPSQALAMYTINAAYASFEDDIKGSITRGKLADMVVLSDNPITSPLEQMKDIRVEITIIDSKVVWEA